MENCILSVVHVCGEISNWNIMKELCKCFHILKGSPQTLQHVDLQVEFNVVKKAKHLQDAVVSYSKYDCSLFWAFYLAISLYWCLN